MIIEYQPIGIVHSPFTELSSMPIQPAGEEVSEQLDVIPAKQDFSPIS